jgi:hypothetical protein
MSEIFRRVSSSTLWAAALTLTAVALVAIVVGMSNARSGTITYSVTHYKNPILGIHGFGPLPVPCSLAPSQCVPVGGLKKSRRRATLLLPLEAAVGSVLAVSALALLWMARRGRPTEDSTAVSEEPLASPSTSRRRPANAREAVMAAFADVEERLSVHGFTREPWEAAETYLARALPDAWREGRTALRLAQLYAVARYSHHPIDSAAATQAVGASTELIEHLDQPLA